MNAHASTVANAPLAPKFAFETSLDEGNGTPVLTATIKAPEVPGGVVARGIWSHPGDAAEFAELLAEVTQAAEDWLATGADPEEGIGCGWSVREAYYDLTHCPSNSRLVLLNALDELTGATEAEVAAAIDVLGSVQGSDRAGCACYLDAGWVVGAVLVARGGAVQKP